MKWERRQSENWLGKKARVGNGIAGGRMGRKMVRSWGSFSKAGLATPSPLYSENQEESGAGPEV